MIVSKQWFREITVSYLPVGHTHEKVDRDLFATVGNLKTLKNCETPDKFPKFVLKSFGKSPNKPAFYTNPLIWDWKNFFGDRIRSIKNLSAFWAFLIKCDELNQPELFYKKNILELTWLGFEGSFNQGKHLFDFICINILGIQLLKEIPQGFPILLQPHFISAEALSDFPKFLEHIKPNARTWWENWLADQPLPSTVIPEGMPKKKLKTKIFQM
jgi:hypothetical protein